jgi:predicted porin
MLYGNINVGRAGSIDYKVFYGDIPMNPEQGVADFFNNTQLYAAPGVSELGMDYAAGAQLFWTPPIDGLKLGVSHSYLSKIFGNGKLAFIPSANINVIGNKYAYTTLSVEYVKGSWTLASEWERVGDEFAVNSIIPFGPPAKAASESWYVSAAYRLNPRFEFGTYYSTQKNRYPEPTDTGAQRQLDDWALSARFDIKENILVKLEYHYIDGRFGLLNTARTPNPVKRDHSSYIAAKTTLSF